MSWVLKAYTLLPPPLASIPAKYWTSVSLLVHSYSVGRSFSIFVEGYSKRYEDAPDTEEAFLIGLLHDIGQKLRLRGKPSEERIVKWIKERLEKLGYTESEVNTYTKYLYTNPAETRTDPLYPKWVWSLLWLADRLQGTANLAEVYSLLLELRGELGINLDLKLANISIPQPFLRSYISMKLYDRLKTLLSQSTDIIIPVSTPYGVVILTDNPSIVESKLYIDWDSDIRGGGLLPGLEEEKIARCMECCKDRVCLERCGGRRKPPDCPDKFRKRDCKERTYEVILRYFGLRHKDKVNGGSIVLPERYKGMFQGVKLTGDIEFSRGDRICPICGVETSVGLPPAVATTHAGLKMEQWARRYYPGNLNILTQSSEPYAVDPLCLGDVFLRRIRLAEDLLISLTIGALTPITVLDELASVAWWLADNLRSHNLDLESLLYDDDLDKVLNELTVTVDLNSGYVLDIFGNMAFMPYRNFERRHQDEWVRDMTVAGVLATWGLYPLTISPSPPAIVNNTLLTYYKGRRMLYDYPPSDRHVGHYTPYVALVLASMSILDGRMRDENLPAFLEVLDYPPQYSPLLLQYSSPRIYSQVEMLRMRLEGESLGGGS